MLGGSSEVTHRKGDGMKLLDSGRVHGVVCVHDVRFDLETNHTDGSRACRDMWYWRVAG